MRIPSLARLASIFAGRALLRRAFMGAVFLGTVFFGMGLQAADQEDTAAATRQYNSAVGLHNSEAYDLAAEEWSNFIKNCPDDSRIPRAHHYLGICYSKQGNLAKAVETFQTVVKNYGDFDLAADTYLNLGLTQYNLAHSGKAAMYDAAGETFGALATKFPRGKYVAQALFYHGECLYNRGKKKEASEKYQLVVTEHADHKLAAQASFALGVAQADLGQHETALKTYGAFLEKHADDPLATEVAMWRGESLFSLKQYSEAAKAYAVAAGGEGFASADYATVRHADSLAAQNQYAEAAALYASVPEKFANSPYGGLCTLEAGKKYYAAGDFAQALGYLKKVVAGGGKSAHDAAHWAARSLLKQNQSAEALKLIEPILPSAEGSPLQSQLLMDQADAMYEISGRRKESVGLYAALAEKHPTDPLAPQAMYMAAFAAMNLADYKTAVTHAETFLKTWADDQLAVGTMHVLAESKLLLNQYAAAEKLYDQLLEKAPDDRDAEIWKVHRGTSMYLQKRYEETIAALQPLIGEIQTAELAAEGWYRIGRSQAALKQYDAAVTSLEASIKAKPKWKLADDAHLVLAYAYQQTGKLDEAKATAEKVIAEYADSKLLDMAHYRLGECCRLGGDLKTAVAQYRKILDDWPNSPLLRQTLYGLGWAKLGLKDYAGAETAFSTLVEQHPDDTLVPRARYGRGMARRQLKQFAGAVEDLQAMLAAKPSASEKSRASHVLGLCRKGLKQFDKAEATLQALLTDDPDYDEKANVYFDLGWVQKSRKKEAEAAATFAKLAEEFPEHTLAADAHYLVGDHAFEKKGYKQASAAYHAAMNRATDAKQPQLAEEAAHKLALTYYMQDDFEKAQEMFAYQQKTWPKGTLVSDGAFREAECFFKLKNYQEAAAAYEKVEKPSSDEIQVVALMHHCDAAGQLKQWEKSLELATRCLEQFPDSAYFAQVLYQQGWAQQNLDKQDEALAIYETVLKKSEKEPAARAQLMIGEIQFGRKQHAGAITSFYKVIYGYGYPKLQADATYEAARCFETMKKPAQALKLYRTLVEKYPDSGKISLAKERIEQLK